MNHREPQAAVRDQADDRRAAFDRAGVIGDELATIVAQKPAQSIGLEMRMSHFRRGILRAQHLLRAK